MLFRSGVAVQIKFCSGWIGSVRAGSPAGELLDASDAIWEFVAGTASPPISWDGDSLDRIPAARTGKCLIRYTAGTFWTKYKHNKILRKKGAKNTP